MEEYPNGYFVFASHKDVWLLEPSNKNINDDYYCGKRFLTEYLQESEREPVGLIRLSTKEAIFYQDYGGYVEKISIHASGIPSDHNQGGQSQNRFHRKRQEAIKAFLKRIRKESKKQWDTEPRVLGPSRLVKQYQKG